ncbi:hypothetical protein SAMN06265360_13022 [Haloechinothrix alba]|uniref:Uncharacterized protein n=1 Tax=Haloechinothrix alba TaxID=664784 RepID=A0A239A464_9PSEU|nr:hypothetical protein SAMN06265360_13022 [Haloechinothrix alba]
MHGGVAPPRHPCLPGRPADHRRTEHGQRGRPVRGRQVHHLACQPQHLGARSPRAPGAEPVHHPVREQPGGSGERAPQQRGGHLRSGVLRNRLDGGPRQTDPVEPRGVAAVHVGESEAGPVEILSFQLAGQHGATYGQRGAAEHSPGAGRRAQRPQHVPGSTACAPSELVGGHTGHRDHIARAAATRRTAERVGYRPQHEPDGPTRTHPVPPVFRRRPRGDRPPHPVPRTPPLCTTGTCAAWRAHVTREPSHAA